MSGKFALIIGNTEYIDPGLAQLSAPGKDAEDFVRVLKSPNIAAFDRVFSLVNRDVFIANQAIEDFFDRKKPDDLLLFYFSGHGVRDENGFLYLAVKNTNRTRLRSTAIRSDFIREAMDQSRSRRQVLILDCCNSGAFAQGTKSVAGGTMGTASAFEGTGYGRVVLTASDSTQFAWEGDKVIGETQNSLFTHFLIKGLEGGADTDGDGKITVDDLYDYAYERIVSITPRQTPGKWSYKQQGEIILSTNIKEIRPQPLPAELTSAIESSLTFVREGAVKQLEELLKGKNLGLAQSAREALEKIASKDDSIHVLTVARQALESVGRPIPQVKESARLPARAIPKQKQQNKSAGWARSIIIGSSILFLSLAVLGSRMILPWLFQASTTESPTKQVDIVGPIIQPTLSATAEITPSKSIISTTEPTQSIPALVITVLPTDTIVATAPIASTPVTNCTNTIKNLRVGTQAQVVTRPIPNNRLQLRSAPNENAEILEAIPFGTVVTVIDGPICEIYRSAYAWWWEVGAPEQTGWVVEGQDSTDKIYILPINPKDGATYIYIPPGGFTMGLTEPQADTLRTLCNDEDCEKLYEASQPAQPVELNDGYWIYRTEVSNAQYKKCDDAEICEAPRFSTSAGGVRYYGNSTFDNYPVVWVDWNQADRYCQWAGGGLEGRLPTSAEWEYAARGGDDGRLFPWGNELPDGSQANVWIPGGSQNYVGENPNGFTNAVDEFAEPEHVSPFGLLNMTGNVWEWVNDSSNFDQNEKVGRGGSSWIRSALSSVAVVDSWGIQESGSGVGFRCVINPP